MHRNTAPAMGPPPIHLVGKTSSGGSNPSLAAKEHTIMRYVAAVLLFATIAVGQNSTSTTQTNCTLNGNMANCTSNTQTQVQPQQSNAQSAQQMHDGMEALGTALGTSVAYHKANKWVKKYC